MSFDEFDDTFFDKSKTAINQTHIITDAQIGVRLDKVCADVFGDFSRAQLQHWIEQGDVLVDNTPQKCKYRVKLGQILTLNAVLHNHGEDLPENIPLEVIYEDTDVLVINKPAGLVVHAGAGNPTGTLVNALLYHYPDNAHLPRAGLVHRIDKDTTGLLVVARTKKAQLELMAQLKDKSVYRKYVCIALGVPSDILRHATIDAPIGRHRTHRTKMTVTDTGKPAVTHIMSAKALGSHYSLLEVRLETGRTHQIRVHLSHLGFALLGDPVYGRPIKSGLDPQVLTHINTFKRQALHAHQLGFIHPSTGEQMVFEAPMPQDMTELVACLADD